MRGWLSDGLYQKMYVAHVHQTQALLKRPESEVTEAEGLQPASQHGLQDRQELLQDYVWENPWE